MRAHFRCGHNISHDSQLLLLISSIGGLNITELDEQTKEVAAKCIECGYLRKNKDIIEPNIVVFNSEHEKEFEDLSYVLCDNIKGITNKISDELGAYIKKKIPKHLVGDYKFYNSLIASPGLLTKVIDECIKEGLLNDPHEKLCGEGVVMIVSR